MVASGVNHNHRTVPFNVLLQLSSTILSIDIKVMQPERSPYEYYPVSSLATYFKQAYHLAQRETQKLSTQQYQGHYVIAKQLIKENFFSRTTKHQVLLVAIAPKANQEPVFQNQEAWFSIANRVAGDTDLPLAFKPETAINHGKMSKIRKQDHFDLWIQFQSSATNPIHLVFTKNTLRDTWYNLLISLKQQHQKLIPRSSADSSPLSVSSVSTFSASNSFESVISRSEIRAISHQQQYEKMIKELEQEKEQLKQERRGLQQIKSQLQVAVQELMQENLRLVSENKSLRKKFEEIDRYSARATCSDVSVQNPNNLKLVSKAVEFQLFPTIKYSNKELKSEKNGPNTDDIQSLKEQITSLNAQNSFLNASCSSFEKEIKQAKEKLEEMSEKYFQIKWASQNEVQAPARQRSSLEMFSRINHCLEALRTSCSQNYE